MNQASDFLTFSGSGSGTRIKSHTFMGLSMHVRYVFKYCVIYIYIAILNLRAHHNISTPPEG